MVDETPHRNDNQCRVLVATTADQVTKAFIVRAAAFLSEDNFSISDIFDGNDACSTHLLIMMGEEPIGSSRLRFFNGFAKVERTGFRKTYRNVRYLRFLVEFIFRHCAEKGYPILLTYAEERYARIWMKLFGFEMVEGRPQFIVEGKERIFELVKTLSPHPTPVSRNSDPLVHFRTEGSWDKPSQFETR